MKPVTKRTRLKQWLSSTIVHDNLHIICIFRYLHLSKEQAPSLSDIIDIEKPKPVSGFSLAKPNHNPPRMVWLNNMFSA